MAKFLAGEDHGFIEIVDGREVFFHRNSVLDDAFDRLTVGSEVLCVPEMTTGAQIPRNSAPISSSYMFFERMAQAPARDIGSRQRPAQRGQKWLRLGNDKRDEVADYLVIQIGKRCSGVFGAPAACPGLTSF